MLNVSVSLDEGIPVIRLGGRFDGSGAAEFDKATKDLRGESRAHWVVDFAAVDYLSSAGIRTLISSEKRLRAGGGRLVLAGVSAMIQEVLDASGLLKEFLFAPDASAALASARQAEMAGPRETRVVSGIKYDWTPLPGEKPVLEWWGAGDWMIHGKFAPKDLEPVRLSELGFALGAGGLGANREQAAEGFGEFIAAGPAMGVLPADGRGEPDFAVTARPEEAAAFLAFGVSFRGAPSARVVIGRPGGFHLGELADGLMELLDTRGEKPAAAGFVLIAEARRLARLGYPTPDHIAGDKGTIEDLPAGGQIFLTGIVGDGSRLAGPAEKALGEYLRQGGGESAASARRIHAHAFWIENVNVDFTRDDPRDAARAIANLESLRGSFHAAPETELAWAKGWIFVPKAIRPGTEGRLRIEWPAEFSRPDEWDTIVRRIYHDASKVVLTQLHGGFTAPTFQAAAYDAEGRQMLPTVLKMQSIEMERREEAACREYVQKYILNNGTVILGSATQGKYAGLRYNFVGISGPESRLSWLRQHYERRPTEELIPIFDRIFTEILKPWYGQPRWERVRLFEQHNPLTDLFPNLLEDARTQLGVTLDEPTLNCPFLNRALPNPYYVLKHVYPKRRNETTLWYTAINHGDLNMQNILLDERENIYIIDFSETCPRNIVSDFARLEPIFLFEIPKLDSDEELGRVVRFAEKLFEQKSLAATPEFAYDGDDPMIRKAYDLIVRLRRYANVVTLFETQMTPYWLAMLQWTLPVASYRGLEPRRKQMALYASALLCEQVMR